MLCQVAPFSRFMLVKPFNSHRRTIPPLMARVRPDLEMALVEAVLRRSGHEDDRRLMRWLIERLEAGRWWCDRGLELIHGVCP